jgi:hypothetical protein
MKHKISSFEEIKRKLEDSFSYLILEKRVTGSNEKEYIELVNIIDNFESDIIEHDVYSEISSSKILLVAKLRPNVSERMLMKLNKSVPSDISAYFYENANRK